jgi:DNA-binding CsgD family transcriptional regulator
MSTEDALHLEDDGVVELLRDFDALRLWEVLRSARTAVTVAELRRRMLAVIEFLAAPRPRPPQPRGARSGSIRPPLFCNQAIAIRLDPIVGELLPLPAVWMTPRSKLERSTASEAEQTGLPALAPREREVALALADGLSRAHVAERMRLSVHTVATLARRVYRKLGVSSQAALAARLAGHERRKLGER